MGAKSRPHRDSIADCPARSQLLYRLSYTAHIIIIIIIIIIITAIEFSLGGSSPTIVQTKQIRINIHKRNNTKRQYKQYKTQYIQAHTLPNHPHIVPVVFLERSVKLS